MGWTLLDDRLRREAVPDDHAGARAPGDRGHVGEDVGGTDGEGEDEDPGEEFGGAPRAGLLHALERALAQERRVVAALEEIEEPEIELLVHPEVAGAARL